MRVNRVATASSCGDGLNELSQAFGSRSPNAMASRYPGVRNDARVASCRNRIGDVTGGVVRGIRAMRGGELYGDVCLRAAMPLRADIDGARSDGGVGSGTTPVL